MSLGLLWVKFSMSFLDWLLVNFSLTSSNRECAGRQMITPRGQSAGCCLWWPSTVCLFKHQESAFHTFLYLIKPSCEGNAIPIFQGRKLKLTTSGYTIFSNSKNSMCAKSLQSCPTLCDPVDCSPPGSSVHGVSQARILEWSAMPSSRGSSQPRDWTRVYYVSCIGRRFFTTSTSSAAQPFIKVTMTLNISFPV